MISVGYNEKVVVHYLDSVNGCPMPVTKDQDLTAMFNSFQQTKTGKVVFTVHYKRTKMTSLFFLLLLVKTNYANISFTL
uniref:Uncharacterized protein n=1 Tax=Arundo donax TaxID=35708 RepID=A0A0A8YHU2_ARUDO